MRTGTRTHDRVHNPQHGRDSALPYYVRENGRGSIKERSNSHRHSIMKLRDHDIPDHGEFDREKFVGTACGIDWYRMEFPDGEAFGMVNCRGWSVLPVEAIDPEWIETHVE